MRDSLGRRLVAAVIVVALVSALATGVAAAQDGGGEGAELIDADGWAAVAMLLVGTLVLMASVELLIHALVRTAVRFGVSAFLLAVVFSGWEFDNIAFGVFTGFREMQNVAFGLAIGNAVSIFGLTLALGAVLFPFVTDVPNDYLAITVGAPLLLVPVIVSGTLTPALSVMFLFLYVVIFAYIFQRERQLDRAFMRSDEVTDAATVADGSDVAGGRDDRGGTTVVPDGSGAIARRLPATVRAWTRLRWFWPAMLVVAVGGIVVGAEASATGVEGILDTWQLSGTFVGVTFITLLFTVDDLLLIVEPLRLGYYDVAVGGVVGSLVFFVTANIGIIGLVGEITFRPETVFLHLPVLFLFAGLSSYLLYRGEMSRLHGALLLGLYAAYILVNVLFLSGVPVAE